MKNITQVLSNEHQNILKVIDAMLKECEKLEAGEPLNVWYFEKVIDFIKNYADKFHHAKEEDILFVAMLANVNSLHCNPIPVMLHEHDTGRTYVEGIEEGLSENNRNKVIENARGYAYLIQNHIYKEDNVLYPMAEEALNEDQKNEIIEKYRKVAESVFNENKIEELLNNK